MTVAAPALQRLERILVMVPWLLEHPGVSVDEISERFEVSGEDLAADLDILGYCGLPGYGGGDLVETSIVGDRVVVRMADFFRRPLRLSLREALTMILAARVVGGLGILPDSGPLQRAEDKLHHALAGPERRGNDPMAPAVAVDLRAPGDEHLPTLREAVAARRVVRLVYRAGSTGTTTERDVEPWAVVGSLGAWYLQGFCRLVEAPRDFRLDRVRQLVVTDEAAGPRPGPPAPPRYEPAPEDTRVILELQPEAWWLAEWLVTDDASERGQRLRITFRTPALDWAARLVLGLGSAVRVLEPDVLRAQVATLARAILARYGT